MRDVYFVFLMLEDFGIGCFYDELKIENFEFGGCLDYRYECLYENEVVVN